MKFVAYHRPMLPTVPGFSAGVFLLRWREVLVFLAVLVLGACADDGAGEGPPALNSAGVPCLAGESVCGGVCVNTDANPNSCGECGLICGADQLCDHGSCRLAVEGCSPNLLQCGQSCLDASSDPANCGVCGNECDALNGFCQAGACACSAGLTACENNVCSNLMTDVAHCGSCGTACLSGQTCQQGSCVCAIGNTECSGACVNLMTDLGNCGTCGTECAPSQVCEQGSCVCPAAQTLCTDACVDLQSDPMNCGVCGTACLPTEVCAAGSCECPAAETLCGDACVDTMMDGANCGGCGIACFEGQLCIEGGCVCPDAQTECGGACVDTLTDVANCGSCDNACPEVQVCTDGECVCPDGQSFCDGVCIDTLADIQNCGTCGNECAFGEGCEVGECRGGAEGEDGCAGIAQNISIDEIAVYQTVKIPIMSEGSEVGIEERVSDVVAGRATLVRAFVAPGGGWQPRTLSARLFLQNEGLDIEVVYAKSTLTIEGPSEEEERESAFEFDLAPEQVTPDTVYGIEIVECETGQGEELQPRFPLDGAQGLGAREVGGLRIHIIPFRANNRLPATDEQGLQPYVDGFLASYPISSLELTVDEPVDLANDQDWNGMLNTVATMRYYDDPDPDVYYYGMLRSADTFQQYCGGGCVAGVGFVPQGERGAEQARASVGVAFGNDASVVTMLHEIGHNHGRNHAPCAPGGQIDGVDPQFPYSQASVGVYGYDRRTDLIITPERYSDIMGYCDNQWFSDYTYNGILDQVASLNQIQLSVIPSEEQIGSWRVLLVDPAFGSRWGYPIPGPAVATGVPESADVLGASGDVIATVTVYRTEVSEIDGFSVQVPEPEPGWQAVSIAGIPPIAF